MNSCYPSQRTTEKNEILEYYHDWIRKSCFSVRTFADLVYHHQISTQKGYQTLFVLHMVVFLFLFHLKDREQNLEIEIQDVHCKQQLPQQKSLSEPTRRFHIEIQSTWCLLQSRGSFVKIWDFYRARRMPQATVWVSSG
jgi:hypothetical protein